MAQLFSGWSVSTSNSGNLFRDTFEFARRPSAYSFYFGFGLQQVTKVELVINLKTAKAPPSWPLGKCGALKPNAEKSSTR
jgi:hypothetical protein